jgi:hypothetical protein
VVDSITDRIGVEIRLHDVRTQESGNQGMGFSSIGAEAQDGISHCGFARIPRYLLTVEGRKIRAGFAIGTAAKPPQLPPP